jgi:hypothetical protein
MDVIAHQQLVDYMARAKEGVETMQQLTKSKQIASDAAAQAELAKQAQTQAKFYNDYVKMTMGRTDIPEGLKHGLIDTYGLIHGFRYSGAEGGSLQPGAYAAPMIEELQKRYTAGNMTAEDLQKGMSNIYPSFLYPSGPQSSTGTPPVPPKPAPAPIKTTTTTTDGNQGGDQGGDQGGVTAYGGTVGQD